MKSDEQAMADTTYVNAVDAPSLALMVPILFRGLRERSTTTKRRAAFICGSLCSLVSDPSAMMPYLIQLLPELKKALVDPNPEVRSTSAKALGGLTKVRRPREGERETVPRARL